VAAAAAAALLVVLLFAVLFQAAPLGMRFAFGITMGLVVFVYGFLVAYVYGDARSRGMRHRVWALVAAFVPHALGLLIYFIVRAPRLVPCVACGTAVRGDLAFCPQCGSARRRLCGSCRRPVEADWSHCAHCGAKL
jgi:hypothetical protein